MIGAPLSFVPVYQTVVWGGDALARLREGVPGGPVGEAWDVADHPRGQSVVAEGPLQGASLGELTARHGHDLVGPGFRGGPFPLMVKVIDARQRLSVQVHPDDALAREMALKDGGKDECWWVLNAGGELYVGTRPGVDEAAFEAARAQGQVAEALQRVAVGRGDFVSLPARTVHAIGAGCLLVEVQQTSDNTFRVDDWGRVGLDGAPRPLHLEAARRAIRAQQRPKVLPPGEGARGRLVDGPSFTLDEVRPGLGLPVTVEDACAVVVALDAALEVQTAQGALTLPALGSALIPAAATSARLAGHGLALVAHPVLRR